MDKLSGYLETDGSCVFQITKDAYIHDGRVVYRGRASEENPAYQMYRDGIERLAFHQGLTKKEFLEFLRILRHHAVSRSQKESDIVTDLWEADFSCISYDTTDVFWQDETLIDFHAVRVADPAQIKRAKQLKESPQGVSISRVAGELDMFTLSVDDISKTSQMIQDEEARNFDADIFEVLLVILKEQKKEDDFEIVLDIILESFQHTLERAEFSYIILFFDRLNELKESYVQTQSWAIPYIDDFVLTLSSNEAISSLHEAWKHVDLNDTKHLSELRTALTKFPPQAIHALCPMILQVPSLRLQNLLIDAIKELAKKDAHPLIKLLSHPDDSVAQNVVHLLGYVSGQGALTALKQKFNTSSGSLRLETVKSLGKRKPLLTEFFFPLVDDPQGPLRDYAIKRIGQEKNPLSEEFLIDCIRSGTFKKEDHHRLLSLYRALGGCGSAEALPFLQKQTKKHSVIRRKLSAIHREGATLALGILDVFDGQTTSDEVMETPSS
ncbi:HEAT repeat domain-containing protein [Desulfoluna limicola]|nr:hypothetical protein [Desulfoluna limicola]